MSKLLLDRTPIRKEECPLFRFCDSQYADCNGGYDGPYVEFDFSKCKMCTTQSPFGPLFC